MNDLEQEYIYTLVWDYINSHSLTPKTILNSDDIMDNLIISVSVGYEDYYGDAKYFDVAAIVTAYLIRLDA